MWLCSPDLSGLQNRERSQVEWDEYSQLTPEQTCTQQCTVSAHSSLSGLRGGRGFRAWKWIDEAQEVSCPLGGKLKLLKEQSDKTVCCPSPLVQALLCEQTVLFMCLIVRAWTWLWGYNVSSFKVCCVSFLYAYLSDPKVPIQIISLISSSFSCTFFVCPPIFSPAVCLKPWCIIAGIEKQIFL